MALYPRSRFCLTALGAVLASGARSPALAQALPTVRVGTDPADTYAEAYYAQEMGFFKKAGLNVELVDFTVGAQIADAVAGGAIDIGIDNPVHLVQATSRGVPFEMIAGGALYSAKAVTTALCVAKDSPLRTAKDLEGKVIAISALKSVTDLAVKAWLTQNGAEPSKVQLVELAFSAMGPALARGTIAAATIAEPALTAATNTTARVFARVYDAVAPQFLLSGWFTTQAYIQKNRAGTKKFVAAIYEAGRWANTHHDESAAILSDRSKVNVTTIRSMTRAYFADSLRASDIQSQLDGVYKFGLLDHRANANDMIARY